MCPEAAASREIKNGRIGLVSSREKISDDDPITPSRLTLKQVDTVLLVRQDWQMNLILQPPSTLAPCRMLRFRYFLRGPFGHDLTASIAAFRPEIDDPVSVLNHIKVMFDHHHAVAGLD